MGDRAASAERDALAEKADKFMWQVRDACVRAEKAEAEAARLRLLCAQLISAAGGSITLEPRQLVERDWVLSCEEDPTRGGFIYRAECRVEGEL